MKRVLLLIIITSIFSLVSGCSPDKNNSQELTEHHEFEEETIDFDIEQILFSKSFQSIEPTVELISKNSKIRVMASLGLSEYSSVSINNITKKGNEINIHVSGTANKRGPGLAVPQVIMELINLNTENVDNLKFNIVYDDYTPIKIKSSINDVLNKVQSHFKVSIKKIPDFDLNKIGDSMVWSIKYDSVFDMETHNMPLVNLTAKIDANSGDILESDKVFISTTLDKGQVLDYAPGNSLLYKKVILESEDDNPLEQLWVYDINTKNKTMLYSSNFKISLARYSPDFKFVSLLETNDKSSDLFIVSLDDLRSYKVFINDKFNPNTLRWADNNILYLIDSKENSTIYSYDIENNETQFVQSLNGRIENIIVNKDSYILVENSENEINKKILLTEDWQSYRNIGHGFSPRFIDENSVLFLQKDIKNDTNSLIIFNTDSREITNQLDDNIVNYQILPDGSIVYIKKDTSNQFTLMKYILEDDSTYFIANLIGEKVYYDNENNIMYLNILLPLEDEKTEVIYKIDISKLN